MHYLHACVQICTLTAVMYHRDESCPPRDYYDITIFIAFIDSSIKCKTNLNPVFVVVVVGHGPVFTVVMAGALFFTLLGTTLHATLHNSFTNTTFSEPVKKYM